MVTWPLERKQGFHPLIAALEASAVAHHLNDGRRDRSLRREPGLGP
jgi:hypothetical protein